MSNWELFDPENSYLIVEGKSIYEKSLKNIIEASLMLSIRQISFSAI